MIAWKNVKKYKKIDQVSSDKSMIIGDTYRNFI